MLRRSYSSIVSQSRRKWNANSIVQQAQKRETVSSSFCRSKARSTSALTPTPPSASFLGKHEAQQTIGTNNSSTLFNFFKSTTATTTNPLLTQAREALPYIGNGAYLAICSGFLMTDMLQLRLLLVGGYSGLVLFHSLHAKPLKIPLRWSFVFVMINAGAAAFLVLDQFGATLTPEEEALFETHFQDYLTRGQFYHLLQLAHQEKFPSGTVLTTEGQVSPNLYFLLEGQAKVYHHKIFAAYVDQGGFVNDIAFQRQREQQAKSKKNADRDPEETRGAYGTVITNGEAKMLVWDKEELQEQLARRPELDRNLRYLLSRHLMKSLLKQREARHANADNDDPEGWYLTKLVA
ncbi:Popeye conserved region protein [Nitzschia inconspicua]|uniref:Popeye conserved region protein n=1 Tax=Nitzschia inconspicua TaxID=303405 RepID=A0A9K3PE92_9STRA|nr:Popeye conserved region protein [Nitzschia inconspicua]